MPHFLTDYEIREWIGQLSHQVFSPVEIADELASKEICWLSGRPVDLADIRDVLKTKPA
jgi:hypothetical protein